MTLRILLSIAAALAWLGADATSAQDRKPSKKEIDAIRACAVKYANDASEAERRCLFNLVADPCTKRTKIASDRDRMECFDLERAIWDDLLNENFKTLREGLDDDQRNKLRDMQRAWIAYRDTTCGFYYDKIQGTMANMMIAACQARETARRAILLAFFATL